MQMFSELPVRRNGGCRFSALSSWLVVLALLWSSPVFAAGNPSGYPGCATRSITVPWGGTVDANLEACSDFGLMPPTSSPAHGNISLSQGGYSYSYTHNGTTPPGGGSDQFVVQDDFADLITVNVTIQAPTSSITVSPAALPAMAAGSAFNQSLGSAGGVAPYTYTLQSGTLPPGLTLSGDTISGTPTERGSYSFTVRATDAGNDHADKGYTGTVGNPSLVLAADSGTAVQGVAFSQTLSTSGGVSPYTYQLEPGNDFPAGIGISGAGVVSGTTNAATGSYPVTLRVTDSSTGPGSYWELKTYTLTVSSAPVLSIDDVSAAEGDAGTTDFTFTVSLNAAAGAGGVSFDIATADGTATTAGSDYVAKSLTGQTIPAGSSTYTFTVQVNGDTLNEADETFFVNVTNVSGATVGDGQGLGTIINDDPVPALSIDDVSVVEGNAGTTNAVFTVTLDAASGQTVSVDYATADGTATAGSDYVATSGTLTFTAGQTTRTITVTVNGDTTPEGDETFFVNLSGATNATIADGQGTGTITNDDVPITLDPASLSGGTVAAAYNQTLSASGGTAPYTFAVTTGTLPAGLTLAADGTLDGTPTAGGTFNLTITATDSSPSPGPFSGSESYSLVIAPPTITLPAASLPDGVLGAAYSGAITAASGGTTPHSYAVTAGALPAGLALDGATGGITGNPSAAGAFNFDITASDSSTGTGPYSAVQSYSITVLEAPTTSDSSLNVAYGDPATNVPLSLGGGAPDSLTIVVPPAHGTASVTGPNAITYQPDPGYAGPDSFAYTATNTAGTSAQALVSITVADAVVTVTANDGLAATAAAAYTQTFEFDGGAQPWSNYQVTNLPAGLTITGTTANTVTVSGAPMQTGTFNLNVSASDSSTGNGPYTVNEGFVLTIAAPVLALAPAGATLNASYGVAYSQAITASGGSGNYNYVLTGALPAGMSFTGNILSGTPAASGSYPISITATDTTLTGTGAPFTVTENYTIDVPIPAVVVTPATLPDPVAGAPYNATLTANGGAAPYAFIVSSGSLPSGLTLAADGTLAGTSNAVGTSGFTVTATDAHGQTGSTAYTLTVAAPTLALAPAAGTLNAPYGVAYNQSVSASGGSGSYNYALTGALPAGMSFDGNALSGTPTAPGSYPVSITATDAALTGAGAPFTITHAYTIEVPAPAIVISPATLPGTVAGQAYAQTLAANGGTGPYAFAVTQGSLPDGLQLAADGGLSGTTSNAGSFGFEVTATDANGQAGTQAYTLVVATPTLTLAPATLPAGTSGSAYALTLSVTGGIAPYSVTLAGPLPVGMTFDAGTLSLHGTPTQSGAFNLEVSVTDSTGGTPASLARSYALTIAPPELVLSPAAGALQAATAGAAYRQTFAATGGIAPYTYAVSAGQLPAGLVLAGDTGALAGTATAAGTFTFSVSATDSTGGTAGTTTNSYTLTVSAPTISVNPDTLPAGVFALAYRQALTAAGGTAPYSFAVGEGALPGGLALSPSGELAGSTTESGLFSFTITATDALGFSGSRSYALSIAQRPDPGQDPEVRGLLNAQSEAARRFAGAQIGNFQQRLQRLHGNGGDGGFANGISFAYRQPCLQDAGITRAGQCDAHRGQPFDADTGLEAAASASGQASPTPWGLWASGQLRSGDRQGGNAGASLGFESDGVSLGADYRISEALAIGAGLGYGRDDSDIGNQGSRSNGQAYTLAAYASYSPGQRFFVDGLLGYQRLDFRLRRHVTDAAAFVHGNRDGSQWLASVATGADLPLAAWQLTPYARLDVARGRLHGYSEQGGTPLVLRYESQDVDTTTGNAGLRADYRKRMPWGALVPQVQAEYQHDFSGSGTAAMQYADLPGMPLYRTQLDGHARNRWVLGAGLRLELDSGWGIRFDYRATVGNGIGNDHGVMLNIDTRFR